MKDIVVVVTGASAGIGAALAEEVGRRGGVAVLAARRDAELKVVADRSGARAIAVTTDVTRRADVERLAKTAIDRAGRIDVWVNNAGRGISKPVSELTDDDLDAMVTINLKSALWGMQAALTHMKARGTGHIINVSTMLSRMPWAHFRSAYSASKAALNSLTTSLRMELAAAFPKIHVSTVLPGVVATDFGLNALGGGMDSRSMPFAQSAGEVANVIADLIANPRAEVHTRPQYLQQQAEYYAAADVAEIERRPQGGRP